MIICKFCKGRGVKKLAIAGESLPDKDEVCPYCEGSGMSGQTTEQVEQEKKTVIVEDLIEEQMKREKML